jgi:quercetin dioxygenase-like cupin family protein
MTVNVVDIEALEWRDVPATRTGKTAGDKPEVRFKPFSTDAPAVPAGQLIEYEPGHVDGRHSHEEDEIYYMLTGDLAIGDDLVKPGMLVFIGAGTEYGPSTTKTGCRFLRLELATDQRQ